MSSGTTRQRGALIVIAAPSGAGKTTLVHRLLEQKPDLRFSISFTTRERRSSEQDGVDYFFVDEDEFQRMADCGELLEHALVFDHWYGTGKAYVEKLRADGHSVLLEIDWQGAEQLRHAVPDATTIFIAPPDIDVLEKRLRGRGTDSEEVIMRRLRDSLDDLGHWKEFDYVIVNDDLATAATELADIVDGGGEAHRSDADATRVRLERLLASR